MPTATFESTPEASVIISCKNEGNNLKRTLESILMAKNKANFDIVVVDDGSTDGCTDFIKNTYMEYYDKKIKLLKSDGIGVAQARNLGVAASSGKFLFFCDAHIKVSDKWLDDLVYSLLYVKADIVNPCIADMENPNKKGYGFKIDSNFNVIWLGRQMQISEIPMASGGAMGIRKDVFEKLGGYEKLFRGYGSEDLELSIRAWLLGHKIIINPSVEIRHIFGKRGYSINPVDPIYNLLCLAYMHFNQERISKVVGRVALQTGYSEAVKLINERFEEIITKRNEYFETRLHDDNFFFRKFNIDF